MLTSLTVKKKKLHFKDKVIFTPKPNLGIVLLGHAITYGPSAKEGFIILDLQKLEEFTKEFVKQLPIEWNITINGVCSTM